MSNVRVLAADQRRANTRVMAYIELAAKRLGCSKHDIVLTPAEKIGADYASTAAGADYIVEIMRKRRANNE